MVKTHSEPSDIVNKDKVRNGADRIAESATKVDAALRGPADNINKNLPEPSDIVNKDRAKMEADRTAGSELGQTSSLEVRRR